MTKLVIVPPYLDHRSIKAGENPPKETGKEHKIIVYRSTSLNSFILQIFVISELLNRRRVYVRARHNNKIKFPG